jgi:hypothetical protein
VRFAFLRHDKKSFAPLVRDGALRKSRQSKRFLQPQKSENKSAVKN